MKMVPMYVSAAKVDAARRSTGTAILGLLVGVVMLVLPIGCSSIQRPSGEPPENQMPTGKVIDLSAATRERRKGFENAPWVGDVSILRLLATPERFNGKKVRVKGYAVVEFEGQRLFPSRDLAISASNGIWLDKDFGDLWKTGPKVFERVLIEGVFDAGGTGHLGLYSGELCMITRFQVLHVPREDAAGGNGNAVDSTTSAPQPK